jgi:hypothetical protein
MISSCRRYQAVMIVCPALQLFLAKAVQQKRKRPFIKVHGAENN